MTDYEEADLREEYDFSGAERGRYKDQFPPGSIAIIDADLQSAFPDSEAVNQALRAYLASRDRDAPASGTDSSQP